MPWHTRNLVEEREAFVQLVESGHEYFSRVCQSFGISRVTGYKWFSRYREAGKMRNALGDQSRRPHRINKVEESVREEVLRLRAQHGWGPQKLPLPLKADGTSVGHSTVYTILKNHAQIPTEDHHSSA